MSSLLAQPLLATDYRDAEPRWLGEDDAYPASSMVNGVLIAAVWFEPTILGRSGPNYAPNAEVLHGPAFSRSISSAAALAIYDLP